MTYDADFFKVIGPRLPSIEKMRTWKVHDVAAIRADMPTMLMTFMPATPQTFPEVERTEYQMDAQDGAKVSLYRFTNNQVPRASPGPAVLHMHGGGMMMGSVIYQTEMIAGYVAETNVQMFSVEYRLAPEHSGTTLVEDCYASLAWIHDHADEFNIDRARIAVMGESAGGGLAASLAILARDRQLSPPLAKQILLAPMLDDRNTEPIDTIEPYALCTAADNLTGWKAVLGEQRGKPDVSPYAAAARVETVRGLPQAYIDVGSLDIFREESVEFARRLAGENIGIDLHVYSGLPHSFELFGPVVPVIRQAFANRCNAIKSI